MNDILTSLFVLLLSVITVSTTAQEKYYRIVWKKDSIGYVQANRIDSANYEVISIHSVASIWFFGSKKIVSTFRAIYDDNGVLVKARTSSTKNGEPRNSSRVSRTNNGYQMTSDNDEKPIYREDITMSVSKLYYREPDEHSSILSERFAEMLEMNEVNPHTYDMIKPNGRANQYLYENGECVRVEVSNMFAHLTIELIQ